MSGEGGRGASRPGAGTGESGGATLVCGATNHDEACRQLGRGKLGSAKGLRVTTGEGGDAWSASEHIYETGVYEDFDLSEAGIVVSDTIDTLENELRAAGEQSVVLCVDALPQPDDVECRERLFRFLHALTRRVRDVDGTCHVHLGVARNASLVATLEPLFDDVVTAAAATPSGSQS